MSRSLASKTALAIRCDALGENVDNTMGVANRLKLEARLRNLEGRELRHAAGSTKGKPKIEVYNKDQKKGGGAMITPAKSYNPAADSVLGRLEAEADDEQMVEAVTDGKKDKKKKKAKAAEAEVADEEVNAKKDKKKKKKDVAEEAVEVQTEEKKKKKRKHAEAVEEETETPSKKKDKKKKKKSEE